MPSQWVRVIEASIITGLGPNAIYALAGRGQVRTRRRAGQPREFRREDLERVRDARTEAAPAAVTARE